MKRGVKRGLLIGGGGVLLAAIVIHFTYDAFIYGIRYLDQVQERARGVSDPKKDAEPHDEE